jgi:hypothetical protein
MNVARDTVERSRDISSVEKQKLLHILRERQTACVCDLIWNRVKIFIRRLEME